MGKDTLSIKQKEILKFIQNELISKGYPPSVREICEAVGLKSTSTVHAHLVRLEKLGYIKRDPTKPRAIELINHNAFISNKELVNVPIVGKVTAGQPILAIENIEGTFPISVQFLGNQEVFMLSVKGDSMIEAGILDNDYVIVNQQPYAEDGDIVVALIGDEATVKTFFKKKDHIVLRPQNPYMDDIIVKDVSILGKVIGVIRLY
ncbi:MAG: transcriptional repressor LexA [Xylanivirga thermophila]|jgi:repressor LexA|uniref:transcriptional repressor LexA n=1 Tax=Xylanivirga thermophila TaxID=2496273 RepID=UPI00101C97F1|nr:transcriptional repressor LexA [Xylanivirga thermophila]